MSRCVFFFNDTAPTKIYTLSLHDALPISKTKQLRRVLITSSVPGEGKTFIASNLARSFARHADSRVRSEEHTSELQSHHDLVCRLLLEKKNKQQHTTA